MNIKFLAPLGEIPKEFQVAKKPDKEEKPVTADEDEDAEVTESDENRQVSRRQRDSTLKSSRSRKMRQTSNTRQWLSS